MRFLFVAYLTKLKSIVSPYLIGVVLLFALGLVAVISVFSSPEYNGIRVGVFAADNGASHLAADYFASALEGRADVRIYTNEREMKKHVSSRFLECAYGIYIEETGKFEGSVILYKSPLTVANPMFDLMMTSALSRVMAGDLGVSVLSKHIPDASKDKIKSAVQDAADSYTADGMRIELLEIYPGGVSTTETSPAMLPYYVNSLYALFALILCLTCGISLKTVFARRVMDRLVSAGVSKSVMYAADLLVLFTISLVFMILCSISAAISGLLAFNYIAVVGICVFSLSVSALCVFLCRVVPQNFLTALLAVTFVFMAITSFIDVAEIIPSLTFINLFNPVRLYINDNIIALALIAVACVAANISITLTATHRA